MSATEDEDFSFVATVSQQLLRTHINNSEEKSQFESLFTQNEFDDHLDALITVLQPNSPYRKFLENGDERWEEWSKFLQKLLLQTAFQLENSEEDEEFNNKFALMMAKDITEALIEVKVEKNEDLSKFEAKMDKLVKFFMQKCEKERIKETELALNYIEIRIEHIENLYKNGSRMQEVFLYAKQLLIWMAKRSQNFTKGYFALLHNDKYVLVDQLATDALLSLNRPSDALNLANLAIELLNKCRMDDCEETRFVDKSVYNVRQIVMENVMDGLQNVNDCNNENNNEGKEKVEEEKERKEARIIVDAEASKGFREGQFWVNDLDSALRIAKDEDTIFISPGTFKPNMTRHRDRFVFSLRKSLTLCGSGASETTLRGSFIKYRSDATVKLKHLRLEMSENEDVYVLEGSLIFLQCVIVADVNTAFFVIDEHGDNQGCQLVLQKCCLDGNQICRRFICFQGRKPRITVESCLISDMYSFLTVISNIDVSLAVLKIIHCVMTDLHDGLKIVVHHQSQLLLQLSFCQFELALLDKECPAQAVSMTGGICDAQGNVIGGGNPDAVGFSLHSLRKATLYCNCVETDGETSRSTCLGKGYVISETLDVALDLNEALGLRVGLELSNNQVGSCEVDQIIIRRCQFKQSSLAIEMRNANPELIWPLLGEILQIEHCHFHTCHYALLWNDPMARGSIRKCVFTHVLCPLVIHKALATNVAIEENTFVELSESEDSSTDEEGESSLSSRRFRLELHLAKLNVPYKIALEKKRNFHFVETRDQIGLIDQQQL